MAVPDWPPTHIMKDLFDKEYKSASGNNVKLNLDFIPWPDYYTRLNASLTSGEKKYNMAVSDSQWLGAFIEGGYYLKINKYVDADPALQAVFKDLHPAVKCPIRRIRTNPTSSTASRRCRTSSSPTIAKIFSATNLSRRISWPNTSINCPVRREEMDAITWDQFRDIGEFFMRKKGDMLAGKPADDDFYGIEFQVGKGYDFFTTSAYEFLWQHGGDIWDETKQPNAHAVGVVNSKVAVNSFEHLLSFAKYMPPEAKTGGLDIFKTDELFPRGQGRDQSRMDRLCRKFDQPGNVESRR